MPFEKRTAEKYMELSRGNEKGYFKNAAPALLLEEAHHFCTKQKYRANEKKKNKRRKEAKTSEGIY